MIRPGPGSWGFVRANGRQAILYFSGDSWRKFTFLFGDRGKILFELIPLLRDFIKKV